MGQGDVWWLISGVAAGLMSMRAGEDRRDDFSGEQLLPSLVGDRRFSVWPSVHPTGSTWSCVHPT